jgi:hypothetical protein
MPTLLQTYNTVHNLTCMFELLNNKRWAGGTYGEQQQKCEHITCTPDFYRAHTIAVCEKTFTASFAPQPAENNTWSVDERDADFSIKCKINVKPEFS